MPPPELPHRSFLARDLIAFFRDPIAFLKDPIALYIVYMDLIAYSFLVRDLCASFRSSQHLSPHTTYQTTDTVNISQPTRPTKRKVKSQPSSARVSLYELE
jgi:hypothetical protein